MGTRHAGEHLFVDGHRLGGVDAAIVVTSSDRLIELRSTDANPKAITVSGIEEGQEVEFYMADRSSTGTYTVACTRAATAGTATMDATHESVRVRRLNGTLRLIGVVGATFA